MDYISRGGLMGAFNVGVYPPCSMEGIIWL